MSRKCNAGKMVLVTLLFWAILILGPFLVMLWNALSPASYNRGTIGYLCFTTVAQGIAACIAWYASSSAFDGAYCRVAGVNSIIGATVFVFLIFLSGIMQVIISNIIAAIALAAGAVYCFRQYDKMKEIALKEKQNEAQ